MRALELGVNYVDTAPSYANSEEVLGRVLREADTPVILSTKLGGRPRPFKPQDKDCLMSSVEKSLRLLGRDHVDMLMIHEPDRPGQYDWWTDLEEYHGPVVELLDELRKDGVIRHTGLGGTTAYELAHIIRTGEFDVVLTVSTTACCGGKPSTVCSLPPRSTIWASSSALRCSTERSPADTTRSVKERTG